MRLAEEILKRKSWRQNPGRARIFIKGPCLVVVVSRGDWNCSRESWLTSRESWMGTQKVDIQAGKLCFENFLWFWTSGERSRRI